jgi:ABC-2 type transport system ATP-binding protein
MAALRARGLVKRFEQTCALDGVDLDVEEGEVRGLLGPNGAGKSTLLRCLLGLVRPDAGAVELLGRPMDAPAEAIPDGVAGFVEEPTFYPYLSGRTNLELLAELDGGDAKDRIDSVLEQVMLADRARDRVSGYSTGMRQRLGIAASLLRGPRLLLLDEPTSGLDPAGARDMRTLVRGLAHAGVSVLISSHLINEVEDACDGFTVLRRGRVVWDGAAAQLRAESPASAYQFGTSDDGRAVELAEHHDGIHLAPAQAGGLSLTVASGVLDDYVVALGREGIAVRRLELLVSPLELMFFALTDEPDPESAGERILSSSSGS